MELAETLASDPVPTVHGTLAIRTGAGVGEPYADDVFVKGLPKARVACCSKPTLEASPKATAAELAH